jgi:hypothetical protein
MERRELEELHYIAPISNISSILQYGILSHARAEKVPHESVAMQEMQERRASKVVPGGRRLHEYVNLYICARNPMLRKRQDRHRDICVLRVSPEVLDIPNTVVSDQNAASEYSRFAEAPDGLTIVDRDEVFAEWWTHPDDQIREWRHASVKCAEVLIPDRVDARFIRGVYVSCEQAEIQVKSLRTGVQVQVDRHLFFM